MLAEKYDKAWIVESDIIPPTDALARLLEVDAPVVSALYVLRHGPPMPSVMQWGETLNSVASAMRWPEIRQNWGRTVRTSGGCTGCTLIDGSVLGDYSFLTRYAGPPDGPLMDHCVQKKIPWMARLDVLCGHKKPEGRVLWPQDFKECN